jgi:2-polyprenyl-3-methyl-5-hydroxy-6-metoxy-1,4-benzoquinol methylase
VARYDAIADFYDATVADNAADPGSAALIDLAGDVRGLRLADLACGQGRITRELARRGATVVGVDMSEGLLGKALAYERHRPLGITYLRADVTHVTTLEGAVFDGVVCNYGLSDIDDVDAALETVARLLNPPGWFVFSILHPCFPGWDEDAPSSWPGPAGYFEEGWWQARNTGFRGKVGANHRTLSTYLNALTHHGFHLDVVDEPRPGADWAARKPGAGAVPVHLVARCLKAD